MLEALPRKRFYLKIDLDSIVVPRALLRLLHGFDRTVGSDGPLYFGNGAYMPPYSDAPWVSRGPPDPLPAHQKEYRKEYRAPLRATATFQALYRAFDDEFQIGWETEAGRRVRKDTHSIPYAQGGFEGFSHASLYVLVKSKCIERVAAIASPDRTCPRVLRVDRKLGNASSSINASSSPPVTPPFMLSASGGLNTAWVLKNESTSRSARCEWASDFEDSALGLCMHLLNIRFMQCTCVTMMPFLPSIPCECSRSRPVGFVINTRRRKCNELLYSPTVDPGLVTFDARDGRATIPSSLFRNGTVGRNGTVWTSAATLIDRSTCQSVYMNATRCPVPISLHPAKTPLQFLSWWTFLIEQDRDKSVE